MKKSALFPVMALVTTLLAAVAGSFLRTKQDTNRKPIEVLSASGSSMLLPDKTGGLYAQSGNTPNIPESEYFTKLVELIDRAYVEPVEDRTKLAFGSIKGMVGSLNDPLAVYMTPDQYQAFASAQRGTFFGVGVELKYVRSVKPPTPEEAKKTKKPVDFADYIPDLVVSAVAPGSPADKAGIKTGDKIITVGSRIILSTAQITKYREDNKRIRESKISDEEMDKQLRKLSDDVNQAIPPSKGKDNLTLGTSGTVEVTFSHEGKEQSVQLQKAKTNWNAVETTPEGNVALRMFTGADAALKKALEGKSSVTIDLRNSSLADFESIGSVLNILAPKGSYGKLTSRSAANSSSLNSTGASKLQLTLIVDESTRGASEILAHALRDAGVAKWIGTKTSGELSMIKTVVLPDGSAYTLPVAKYEALKK